MVLEIPGGLFGQDDVRETATATTGTKYLTIPGAGFTAGLPDADDVQKNFTGGYIQATGNAIIFTAPVNLPNGAVVTAITVYGNAAATAETYDLRRATFAASSTSMATENIGTEQGTITTPTIDNLTYYYYINTSTLDASDAIYGVRITYET